jgi:hypothetical protein
MISPVRRLFFSCLVFALIAAGCSSSSKSSSSSTTTLPALTKADFVKQANDICTATDQKLAAAASGVTESTPQADQVKLLQTKIIPLFRQQIADLRKLSPPAADRAQVTAIFDAMSTGIDQAEQKLKTDPATALGSNYNPLSHADDLASAYGLTACASGSS